jgi:chromosome segregation ATPase
MRPNTAIIMPCVRHIQKLGGRYEPGSIWGSIMMRRVIQFMSSLTLVVLILSHHHAAAQSTSSAPSSALFLDQRRLPQADGTAERHSQDGATLTSLQKQVESLREQLAAATDALRKAEADRQKAEKSATLKERAAEAASKEVAALRERLEKESAERTASASQQDERAAELQHHAEKSEAARRKAEADAEAARKTAREKLAELEQARRELEESRRKQTEAERAAQTLGREKTALEGKLAEAQRDLEESQKRAHLAHQHAQDAEALRLKSEADRKALATEIGALRDVSEQHQATMVTLREELKAAKDQRDVAAKNLKALQDQMAVVKGHAEKSDAERKELEADLAALRAAAQERVASISSARNELSVVTKARETAEARIGKLVAELATLKSALEERQGLSTLAGREAAEARQETKRLQKELQQQLEAATEKLRLADEQIRESQAARRQSEAERVRLAALVGDLQCKNIDLATEPLEGGRIRLNINAPCHAGETIAITYDIARFEQRLDEQGRMKFVLDLFAGIEQPASISFPDGYEKKIALSSPDIDSVTKVALVWKAPVDLDLHALEYDAKRVSYGHIWAGSPASARDAAEEAATSRRGRGFLSFADDGSTPGTHLEVYTFLPVAGQMSGRIRLSLDYASRGTKPDGAFCGSGKYASIAYTLIRKPTGRPAEKSDGTLPAVPCGVPLSDQERYNSDLVKDLILTTP